MKRLIASLLAVLILVSALPLQVIASSSSPETPVIPAGKPVRLDLEVTEKDEDGTVTVAAKIGKNTSSSGFHSLQISLETDDALRLVRVENGDIMPHFEESTLTFSEEEGADCKKKGLLATFTFAAEPGVSRAKLQVKIVSLVNAAGQTVSCDNASLDILLGEPVAIRLEADQTVVDRGAPVLVRAYVEENFYGFNTLSVAFLPEGVLRLDDLENGVVASRLDPGTLTFSEEAGQDTLAKGLLGTFTFVPTGDLPAGEFALTMQTVVLKNAAGEAYPCADATLTLTLTNRPAEIAFSEDCGEVSTAEGENTLAIHAQVFPEDADSADLVWTSADPAIAHVDGNGKDAVITGLSHGETSITVSLAGRPTAFAVFTVTVNCAHDFSQQLMEERYLKEAATCKYPAVYWVSCRFCGIADPADTFDDPNGTLDPENHKGGTTEKGIRPASCTQEGYTGDIVCNDCGEIILPGETLDMLDHTPGKSWVAGEEVHYIPCVNCGTPVETEAHRGGTADCRHRAQCEVCGGEYGALDPENHAGPTKLVGEKEATEEEEGYTGDEICESCGEVTKKGKTIPRVGTAVYGDANGDGEIDGQDIILIKQYLAAYDYTSGTSGVEVSPGADANGDGEIDGQDIILIKQYLAAFDYEKGESSVELGPKG